MFKSIRRSSSSQRSSYSTSPTAENPFPAPLRLISQTDSARTITLDRHPSLGFELSLRGERPCRVVSVRGHALEAGLREGDVLLELDGRAVTDWPHDELVALLWSRRREIKLRVMSPDDENIHEAVRRPALAALAPTRIPDFDTNAFFEVLSSSFNNILSVRRGTDDLYMDSKIDSLVLFVRSFEVRKSSLANPRTTSTLQAKLLNWSKRPVDRAAQLVRMHKNSEGMFCIEPQGFAPKTNDLIDPAAWLSVPEHHVIACGRFRNDRDETTAISSLLIVFLKLSNRRLSLVIVRQCDGLAEKNIKNLSTAMSNSHGVGEELSPCCNNQKVASQQCHRLNDNRRCERGTQTKQAQRAKSNKNAVAHDLDSESKEKGSGTASNTNSDPDSFKQSEMRFSHTSKNKFRREPSKSHESLFVVEPTNDSKRPSRNWRNSISILTDIAENEDMAKQISGQINVNPPEEDPLVRRWSISLRNLLDDSVGVYVFRKFLQSEFSEENLDFWVACNQYKNTDLCQEREQKARDIWLNFLDLSANRIINVDDRTREICLTEIESIADEARELPSRNLFVDIQEQIYKLMKYDSYQRFLRSEMYQECLCSQNNRISGGRPSFCQEKDDVAIAGASSHTAAQAFSSPVSPNSVIASNQDKKDKRIYSLLPWTKALMKWKRYSGRKPDQVSTEAPSSSEIGTVVQKDNSKHQKVSSERNRLSGVSECAIELPDDSMFRVLIEPDPNQNGKYPTLEQLLKVPLAKRGYVWFRSTLRDSYTGKRVPYSLPAHYVVGLRLSVHCDRVIFILIVDERPKLAGNSNTSMLISRHSQVGCIGRSSSNSASFDSMFNKRKPVFAISAGKTDKIKCAIEAVRPRLPMISLLLSEGSLYAIDGRGKRIDIDSEANSINNRCLLLTNRQFESTEDVPLYGVDLGGYDHFDGFLEEDNLNLIEHIPIDDIAMSALIPSQAQPLSLESAPQLPLLSASSILRTPSPPAPIKTPIVLSVPQSTPKAPLLIPPIQSDSSEPIVDISANTVGDSDDDDAYSLPDTFRRPRRRSRFENMIYNHESSCASLDSLNRSSALNSQKEADNNTSIANTTNQLNTTATTDSLAQNDNSFPEMGKQDDEQIVAALISPRSRRPINWK